MNRNYNSFNNYLETGMQKISPFLWYDKQAEDAAKFYTAVFKNSKMGSVTKYNEASGNASGMKPGSVMTASFEIEGYNFTAINGGPVFKINPSISFFVNTKDEKEVDDLWAKFSDGGKVLMELNRYDWSKKYGWVEDKFGISWQLMLIENDVEQKIVPSFLFTGNVFGKANEAINYYTSVFKNAKVDNIYKYGPEALPDNPEALMYADFTLEGNKFAAMDGAGDHDFQFNEAISFVVNCEDQKEIDHFWNKLSEGGDPKAQMCGWLKDKYGVSWQIVPAILPKLLSDGKKSKKVMEQVLQMKKLDIKKLEEAYNA
jgi:predicted 3-demethylubiquinone-9 3-methyltransferase (glyoxalase superfamily)